MASRHPVLEKSRPRVSLIDYDPDDIIDFIRNKLVQKKVNAAFIFGSLARKTHHAWSDIDLIIIRQTSKPFLERARDFDELYELNLPLDILVYTPEEFNQLDRESSGFWKELKENRIKII